MGKLPGKPYVLSSKDLEKLLGSRMAIKRLVDSGELQSLRSGLYASADLDPFSAVLLAVAKYYPKGVLSNRTALYFHNLSDDAIDLVDVDIRKGGNIQNRFLKVHRVVPARLIGKTKISVAGQQITIYDLERTLCEAYLLDPAGADFFKALKRYLKNRKPDTTKIKRYDQALGTKVLTHLMQELADD